MAIIPLLKGIVFLLSCIAVFGDHAPIQRPVGSPKYPKSHPHNHHEGHPPSPPPAHPPSQHNKGHPPSPPPAHHPPSHAPHPRRRSPVAVQGVVYCKPCKYRGIDTLWEATPLLGLSQLPSTQLTTSISYIYIVFTVVHIVLVFSHHNDVSLTVRLKVLIIYKFYVRFYKLVVGLDKRNLKKHKNYDKNLLKTTKFY